MSRVIPIELQQHLNGTAKTVCYALRIITKNGNSFGVTNLDKTFTFNGTVYNASSGFDSSKIVTDTTFSVNNSEAKILISSQLPTLTEQSIASGLFDDARYELRLLNFEDFTQGSVLISAGDVGEVSIIDGALVIPEMLDYMMRLRQPIGHFTSRTCRAVFGKLPHSSMTGCGVDAESMFVAGEVSAAGLEEPYRTFFDETRPLEPFPKTARLRWTSGNNAGSRLYQVESYYDGILSLMEPVLFRIEIGDQYEVRPDCDKTELSCKLYNNWINFKGESLIPVEGSVGSTPGASTATTLGALADSKGVSMFGSKIVEIFSQTSFRYDQFATDPAGRQTEQIKWKSGANTDKFSTVFAINFDTKVITIEPGLQNPIALNDEFYLVFSSSTADQER